MVRFFQVHSKVYINYIVLSPSHAFNLRRINIDIFVLNKVIWSCKLWTTFNPVHKTMLFDISVFSKNEFLTIKIRSIYMETLNSFLSYWTFGSSTIILTFSQISQLFRMRNGPFSWLPACFLFFLPGVFHYILVVTHLVHN